eukprot:scaffold1906_cov106-Isochrysis_galbana.AAC.6
MTRVKKHSAGATVGESHLQTAEVVSWNSSSRVSCRYRSRPSCQGRGVQAGRAREGQPSCAECERWEGHRAAVLRRIGSHKGYEVRREGMAWVEAEHVREEGRRCHSVYGGKVEHGQAWGGKGACGRTMATATTGKMKSSSRSIADTNCAPRDMLEVMRVGAAATGAGTPARIDVRGRGSRAGAQVHAQSQLRAERGAMRRRAESGSFWRRSRGAPDSASAPGRTGRGRACPRSSAPAGSRAFRQRAPGPERAACMGRASETSIQLHRMRGSMPQQQTLPTALCATVHSRSFLGSNPGKTHPARPTSSRVNPSGGLSPGRRATAPARLRAAHR